MKYTEFKKLMNNKGLIVDRVSGGHLRVRILNNRFWTTLAMVNIRTPNSYSVTPLSSHPRKLVRFVAQKCMELAFTELEDRK